MTTFDDRENAFEAKFAHDSEMQFKAEARRNKLLGLWAAGLMGKSGDEAAAYALDRGLRRFRGSGRRGRGAQGRGRSGGQGRAPTRCAPRWPSCCRSPRRS
jgi:hypothetical protein